MEDPETPVNRADPRRWLLWPWRWDHCLSLHSGTAGSGTGCSYATHPRSGPVGIFAADAKKR